MRVEEIHESERYIYYVTENAEFYRISKKHGTKFNMKPYKGYKEDLTIIIGYVNYIVKTLIATLFIEGYDNHSEIEFADGNPENCSASNLIIRKYVPMEELCLRYKISSNVFSEIKSKFNFGKHIFESDIPRFEEIVNKIRNVYGKCTPNAVCDYYKYKEIENEQRKRKSSRTLPR